SRRSRAVHADGSADRLGAAVRALSRELACRPRTPRIRFKRGAGYPIIMLETSGDGFRRGCRATRQKETRMPAKATLSEVRRFRTAAKSLLESYGCEAPETSLREGD